MFEYKLLERTGTVMNNDTGIILMRQGCTLHVYLCAKIEVSLLFCFDLNANRSMSHV